MKLETHSFRRMCDPAIAGLPRVLSGQVNFL